MRGVTFPRLLDFLKDDRVWLASGGMSHIIQCVDQETFAISKTSTFFPIDSLRNSSELGKSFHSLF
jgi:hypothetical protein